MRKLNRLTMTLALLIAAVGGAWAQSSLNVVEFEVPAGWATDNNPVTAADLPGFKAVTLDEAKAWTGAPAEGYAILFYSFDGNKINLVNYANGGVISDGPADFTKKTVFDNKSNGKFYYTATEPTEWSLTPDETGKKWTLAKMPANNIELQVEYFAESNLFLSKEALADKANISVTAGELGVQFGEDGKSANTVTEGTAMTIKYNGAKKVLGMKVAKAAGNTYQKWDANQKKLVATDIPAEATAVQDANTDVHWAAGTYVVEGNVTIGGIITLDGNVELIIKDGAKLTVNSYILGSDKNLSIYGQANQSGQLVVNCSDGDAIISITTLEVHSCQVKSTASSNGCGSFYDIQTFNVYGGSVDGECTGSEGYGIILNDDGSMNIYGGEVKAVGKGNDKRFGIAGYQATVTVYGGKLWAECAGYQALDSENISNLKKGAGFTGKIETSDNGSSWTEYNDDATPGTKYVRVGY